MPPARHRGKARSNCKCDDGRRLIPTALRIRRQRHRQHDSRCRLGLPPCPSDSNRRPARGQAAGTREHRAPNRFFITSEVLSLSFVVAMFCKKSQKLSRFLSFFFLCFFISLFSLDSRETKNQKPKTKKRPSSNHYRIYLVLSTLPTPAHHGRWPLARERRRRRGLGRQGARRRRRGGVVAVAAASARL